MKLPQNFRFVLKQRMNNMSGENVKGNKTKRQDENSNNKKRKKRKRVREPVQRNLGETEVTSINSYVTHMLVASIGLKLCDNTRRILMYTKKSNAHKSFYSFCRGLFPIHELCGTMTALELAKRDVLGVDIPLWRMLLPAVVIHSMANFRGMKVRIKKTDFELTNYFI